MRLALCESFFASLFGGKLNLDDDVGDDVEAEDGSNWESSMEKRALFINCQQDCKAIG